MRYFNMSQNPYTTNRKLFSHMSHVQNALDNKPMVPVCVELHPTNVCNNKCPWCISQEYRLQQPNLHMDYTLIQKFLDDFKKNGGKSILWSGGGDPLQYRCYNSNAVFYDLANHAQKHLLQQALYTNGNILFDDFLIDMIVNNFVFIRVSLDAFCDETYQIIRKSKHYSQTINNLHRLIDRRNSIKSNVTIGVSYLICPENLNLLEEWLTDTPVDYIYFKPVTNTQNYISENGLFEKASVIIEDYKRQYSGSTNLIIPYNKINELKKCTEKKSYNKCYYHYFCPCIAPDGYVYTCCHMVGNDSFRLFHVNEWIDNKIAVNGSIDAKVMHDCLINCRADQINESIEDIALALQIPHVNYL